MFVAVPHLFVGEVRSGFAQHMVDGFVEVVDIFRKGGPTFHGRRGQRVVSKIVREIFATGLTGENVAKGEEEIAVLSFLGGGGIDGVIERHGMEEVPEGRSPDVG